MFNVVQGIGEEVGAALVAHPGVRRVSFTGSPETGALIGRAAAANIVPFTGELGGKGPLIVFADADLDAAAAKAAGQYDDAGQVCLAGTRLLVQESIARAFLELFHRSADEHVLGDPRDDATTVSPLIHPDHLARGRGVRRAGRARRRPHRPRRQARRHRRPVLRADADRAAVERLRDRPARGVRPGADVPDVPRRAARRSSSPTPPRYGLSAIVYTGSEERAERVGRAVRAGTVWVNTFLIRDLTAPFGGVGISGIGREGGDYALDFYSDLKTLQILEDTTR